MGDGSRAGGAGDPQFQLAAAGAVGDLFPHHRSVDGTYINNVPEQVLFQERAHFIVAADVIEPPAPPSTSALSRLLSALPPVRLLDAIRATSVLMKVADERDGVLAQATFRPPRSGFQPWSFHRAAAIEAGARASAREFARATYQRWMQRTY